jgi:hypothetical protein
MGVMENIIAAPEVVDELHYLRWCRQHGLLFASGQPSARRSAIEMNTQYARETGHNVPQQWVVR